MSLVTISRVSLSFSGRDIFHDIGLQVEPGDRIGLVGPNGSGKTTLLRLIVGEISPETGEIGERRGIRIGYLPQDARAALSGRVLASVLDSVPGRVKLSEEIIRTENSLRDPQNKGDHVKLAEKLAELHQGSGDLEMQFPPHEAERILAGLGFPPDQFSMPVSTLSEGWKMRLHLGTLLYQKPDLLLLDEPTNHLDIPSVHWLEQFLQTFRGALVLVSHDRDFLNRQINRVISLEQEGMRSYRGNYDFYLKARAEEKLTLEAKARHQQQRVKEAQRFIERFRYKATKARQVQSKIKLLKKIELVESYRPQRTIHFSFPPTPRSGREVAAIRKVSKRFGKKTLYQHISQTVLRGERIAIIGPNGSGKTTLLRMVAGEIEPDHGEITLGHEVTMSYFAQHHLDMLDPRKTIFEEVSETVPQETVGYVRSVCGAFLFSGDEVYKSIGLISGGEKARVALAKLLVKPGNFMLMDEPTNHLDLVSSEILIDALAEYSGTVLFVSHNQALINRLATKIWDIREGTVEEYPGNLDEYYDHLDRISGSQALEPVTERLPNSLPGVKKSRKDRKRAGAEKRRLINCTLKPIQDTLALLEEKITDLEESKEKLEEALTEADIFADKAKSVALLGEYNEVRKQLEELMARWEDVNKELEVARRNLGLVGK